MIAVEQLRAIPELDTRLWRAVRDGDRTALALYERHYSARRYRDGRRRRLFVGPGEKLVLLARDGRAVFAWRRFRSDDGQRGVNCSVFRNEGGVLSSDLIREAMEWAWQRWPTERLYTYIDAGKVASSNPGYCFLMAGWRRCGTTKGGHGRSTQVILEALPA
jgi:hypothetical protein